MLTRPARDVDPATLLTAAQRAVQETGNDSLVLLSLSCSDYLALPSVGMEIRNSFRDRHVSLKLPS